MKRYNITDYPVGTKVHIEGDYPDELLREVAGYKQTGGFDYLIFTDGYMAFVGRVAE